MKSSAVLVVLQILLISCNTTEAPPGEPVLRLAALDASCTEVWLEVKLAAGVQPRTVILQRDTQTVLTMTLTSTDTLIVDEGLLPNHPYTYTLTRPAGVFTDRTSAAITTMDTTSHNWTFSIDTLGDGNSSVLYDVAIINDTLAYAVGEMYLRDSTGQIDPLLYNFAMWNGQRWEIKRITVMFRGSPVTVSLEGIFTHTANDIWVAGSIPIHGNGVSWIGYDIQSLVGAGTTVSRMWGTTSEMYFVGRAGNIIYYNGVTWQRIESGTTLDVYDIFGQRNSITGGLEVYAVAAKQFVTFERKILRLADNSVIAVSDSGIPYSLHGLWFKPGRRYFVVGSGMYAKYATTTPGPWRWLHPSVTQYYTYSVRGGQINDIAVCGAFGELLHFNGATWRSYRGQTAIGSGAYYGVAMKGNLIIAVGFESPRATVAVGTR